MGLPAEPLPQALPASTRDHDAYRVLINRQLETHDQTLRSTQAPDADRETALIEFLKRWSVQLAVQNVRQGSGDMSGPYGALVVDFRPPTPKVIGVGANHVLPQRDPTAHAEMEAMRDAAKNLGHSSMQGLTLITSCECCPMCLSTALGARMERVEFAATRADAKAAGFSDEDQYSLMQSPVWAQASLAPVEMRTLAESWLSDHEAVVMLDVEGKTRVFHADADRSGLDPTALPCIRAIQAACAAIGQPHLPESARLISRHQPHPASLMAADWARIGRIRNPRPDLADDPMQDKRDPASGLPVKDTSRILFLDREPEELGVVWRKGDTSSPPVEREYFVRHEDIIAKIRQTDASPRTPIRQGWVDRELFEQPFKAWKEMAHERY